MLILNTWHLLGIYRSCPVNAFIRFVESLYYLPGFCPECGGELKFDVVSKNFICKSCGLFASREKFDELRDKKENEANDRRRLDMMIIVDRGKPQRRISRNNSRLSRTLYMYF